MALSMESTIEQANEIQNYQNSSTESVNKLSKGQSSGCFHCGANTHIAEIDHLSKNNVFSAKFEYIL